MLFQYCACTFLVIAALALSIPLSAMAHDGHEHPATIGNSATVPAVPAPAIQVVPDAAALADTLGLPADTAVRLSQVAVAYQHQQAGLFKHYHATDGAERERLGWLLQQVAYHQRRQLDALLTPEQVEAFLAFVNTGSTPAQQ